MPDSEWVGYEPYGDEGWEASYLPSDDGSTLSATVREVYVDAGESEHEMIVRTLLEMDDRCLKDIGLTRTDVIGALAEPLATDPSRILLVRSLERRARQRPVVTARTASGVPVWRI